MDIELHTATGNEDLDNFLRGLIRLFEISFPARIRSYYLGGSYSDGTAVGHDCSPNASDVDLFVIFRGKIENDEIATFHHVLETGRLTCPILLDANAYSEDDLLRQSGKDARSFFLTTNLPGSQPPSTISAREPGGICCLTLLRIASDYGFFAGKRSPLENEYLRLCHDYVLTQLQQGGEKEQRQVARILQSIHWEKA